MLCPIKRHTSTFFDRFNRKYFPQTFKFEGKYRMLSILNVDGPWIRERIWMQDVQLSQRWRPPLYTCEVTFLTSMWIILRLPERP